MAAKTKKGTKPENKTSVIPPPPGQRYVDVTPDPYLLALALSRVR